MGEAVSKAQSALLAWKISSMSSAELWGPSRSGFTYLFSLNSRHFLSMHQCFPQKTFQVSAWNILCSTFILSPIILLGSAYLPTRRRANTALLQIFPGPEVSQLPRSSMICTSLFLGSLVHSNSSPTYGRYSVKACGWMYKLSQLHDLQVANMVDG